MTAPIRRIGVLTSGGDAPGLNAVIRAVVRSAEVDHGWSILGIEEGFEGLIGRPRTRTLDSSAVSGLLNRGGTKSWSFPPYILTLRNINGIA